jgi:ABC-type transport system involved in cytochrome bd biosynthesis fused ATPase/permease subunit
MDLGTPSPRGVRLSIVRPESPENESDSRFGGWRDWLLVLVGVPIVLASMVVVAAVWRSGSHPRPWPVAVGLVCLALVVGLVVGHVRRR